MQLAGEEEEENKFIFVVMISTSCYFFFFFFFFCLTHIHIGFFLVAGLMLWKQAKLLGNKQVDQSRTIKVLIFFILFFFHKMIILLLSVLHNLQLFKKSLH